MPKTQFVDFKAIKAAVKMEEVLQHYGLLDKFKRNGDSLSGPCPIHGGSNPTQFRVSISKNIWNCFSECKHGGNVLDFIAKKENVTIHGAALKAIEWFNLDKESVTQKKGEEESEAEEQERKPARQSKPAPREKPAPPAEENSPNKVLQFRLGKLDQKHEYLVNRGLSPETIAHFDIGYCNKGMMVGRIAIPITNPAGSVVAYAGRFPGEPAGDTPKYKLPQGFRKSQELFNLHGAIKEPEEDPLVIVEGFFDCMMLHQNGCKKVVALMGSTMSQAQEDLLRKHTTGRSFVILMLDEDDAGRAGREDIACRISRFCFVKAIQFDIADTQPEDLSAEEIQELCAV